VKARMLCLLLLSACSEPDVAYDYGLTWMCQSPEGCERVEELALLDRLNVSGDFLFFHSTRDMDFSLSAQMITSEALPAGCSWLYGVSIFGYELEPSKLCQVANGFELELSIPNALATTHSKWLVEARDLGPW
jgi:hypothetical protein